MTSLLTLLLQHLLSFLIHLFSTPFFIIWTLFYSSSIPVATSTLVEVDLSLYAFFVTLCDCHSHAKAPETLWMFLQLFNWYTRVFSVLHRLWASIFDLLLHQVTSHFWPSASFHTVELSVTYLSTQYQDLRTCFPQESDLESGGNCIGKITGLLSVSSLSINHQIDSISTDPWPISTILVSPYSV